MQRRVARWTAENMKNAHAEVAIASRQFIASDELGQQGNPIRIRYARSETFCSPRRMSFGSRTGQKLPPILRTKEERKFKVHSELTAARAASCRRLNSTRRSRSRTKVRGLHS